MSLQRLTKREDCANRIVVLTVASCMMSLSDLPDTCIHPPGMTMKVNYSGNLDQPKLEGDVRKEVYLEGSYVATKLDYTYSGLECGMCGS